MAAAAILSPTILPSTTSEVVESKATSFAQGNRELVQLPASELLVNRTSSVLQSLGYKHGQVEKVAGRMNANIVSGKVDLKKISTPDIGQLLDTDLLDREKLRLQNVYLNSNEPVLLLEISKENDRSNNELTQVKNDFIELLRARSIVPVRVYVRRIDSLESSQFGFCLLNVVNTDIGGPSMVQLLDTAFHGEGWKNDLTVKEAFNGDSLLWRDEVVAGGSFLQEPQSVVIDEPELVEPSKDEVDLTVETSIKPAQDKKVSQSIPTAYRDINEIPEDLNENHDVPAEHPAMTELRQWEASRQVLEHPSWAREHDGDLLDIITTQSASIKDEDAAFSAKPASDDFELVEKA